MKGKIAIAIFVVLLILAQIIFGGKKDSSKRPEQAQTALESETALIQKTPETTGSGQHEQSSAFSALPRPPISDVTGVIVGSGDSVLRLERGVGDKWDVVGAVSTPADSKKIESFLSDVLTAQLQSLSSGEKQETGLEGTSGIPVKLSTIDGSDYEIRIGTRPEGRFDSAYVRLPGGEVEVLNADIRGELGLWKNTPDAAPDPSAWIQKEVLRFDPEEAVRLEAVYPDHRLIFERSQEGEWEPRTYIPGGEWDKDALTAWLKSLSRFRVSGISGTGGIDKETTSRHEIRITLADASEKTVRVVFNHDGEGMLAESSDSPGHLFTLPEWRFQKYFRPLHSVFPKAVPHFELADIQFIDIRHGGETVKIANRDGTWRAAAWSYPLKTEAVNRLARLLSTWRPEDYAKPDFKTIRPMFAGPMVEVILSGGFVHQYRLAGRHPFFPWRYVMVDNSSIFSIADTYVPLMFPMLADVLDLGKVISGQTADDIHGIRLEDDNEHLLVSLQRQNDGQWKGNSETYSIDMEEAEVMPVLKEMLDWTATGFFDLDSRPAKPATTYRLSVVTADGQEQAIQFFESEERDIPYLGDKHRAYLLERKKFFNWLGTIRAIGDHIQEEVQEEATRLSAEENAGTSEQQASEEIPEQHSESDITPSSTTQTDANANENETGTEAESAGEGDREGENESDDEGEGAINSENANADAIPEIDSEPVSGISEMDGAVTAVEQQDSVTEEAVQAVSLENLDTSSDADSTDDADIPSTATSETEFADTIPEETSEILPHDGIVTVQPEDTPEAPQSGDSPGAVITEDAIHGYVQSADEHVIPPDEPQHSSFITPETQVSPVVLDETSYEPEIIVPIHDGSPTVRFDELPPAQEPPVYVPLSEPADAPDSDLIHGVIIDSANQ